MSLLSTIVRATVTRETTFPSRAGFGVPMFVCEHTLWQPLVRKFTSLAAVKAAVVAGGGTVAHRIYKAALKAFSQNPAPAALVIGKRTTTSTQIVKLTPLVNTDGYVYAFTVTTADGVDHAITYTVASDTLTEVGTALATAIDALTGVAAASVTGVVTCTSDVGVLIRYADLPPIAEMTVQDTSVDPGIQDDLDDIEEATKRTNGLVSWYGFSLDHAAEAITKKAAEWAEARHVIMAGRTSDSACTDTGTTTDVLSDLVTAAYTRILPLFAQTDTQDYRDLAILARCLPEEIGAVNWAFKTLATISVDNLTDEEAAAILAKRGTVYMRTNALNLTFECQTPAGEYIDQVTGADFLEARIAEDVFGLLKTAKILPYTQQGIDAILGTVQARLDKSTRAPNPILTTDGDGPVVDPIKIEDVETSDKASRTLRVITWRGIYSGAINKAEITGTIGV